MTFEAFSASLALAAPPAGLSPALQALWYAGRDDWDRAHDLAQDDPSRAGSWAHAYLHRLEGDAWNAGYWYRKARQPMAEGSLQDEWEAMVRSLLAVT
ncbi:MAG: hypothetical protein D6722_06400 [Bacteroidetes bacterium]|nr:MAG: hypothetical protein D6722_06400 [Bacteroidota bacterium]